MEQYYMNAETGSVDTHSGWWYHHAHRGTINAADEGEVIPVLWNFDNEIWEEV